jgi:hypothetical protein
MNKADRDAEKWIQANQQHQQRELYKAKETGENYFINQFGEVITEKNKEEL